MVQNDKISVYLSPLKRFGFYKLFDQKNLKIFNCNAYSFFYIICVIFALIIDIITILSLFLEEKVDYGTLSILLFVYICSISCTLNNLVLLYKANVVWDLFDITQCDFLKSRNCGKHINRMNKYLELSTKIVNKLFRFYTTIYYTWLVYPLIYNMVMTSENQDQRYENIFNMKFPVSTSTYNQYYLIFYLLELFLLTYIYSNVTMVSIFIILFYGAIIAQYEILRRALKSIGHEDKPNTFPNSK